MRMQTFRWTELLQMCGVLTNGSHSHVGGQVFGEVGHFFHTACFIVTVQFLCLKLS